MRHDGYTILNQIVNVLTEYGLPKMPYTQVLLKDCARPRKYCIMVLFFDNKSPVMQLPVPKNRTVTGA